MTSDRRINNLATTFLKYLFRDPVPRLRSLEVGRVPFLVLEVARIKVIHVIALKVLNFIRSTRLLKLMI